VHKNEPLAYLCIESVARSKLDSGTRGIDMLSSRGSVGQPSCSMIARVDIDVGLHWFESVDEISVTTSGTVLSVGKIGTRDLISTRSSV